MPQKIIIKLGSWVMLLGSHNIKSVGVLFFRADKSISINLIDSFLEELHRTDDANIYRLVRQRIDEYIQLGNRFNQDERALKSRYITMAVFAYYLKITPERAELIHTIKGK